MLKGIDISNLQGAPSAYRNQAWYQAAEFVIVQAIEPPSPYTGWDHVDAVTGRRGYTGEQLTAAREDGKYISTYTYLFHAGLDVTVDQTRRLGCVPVGMPLDFRTWLDEEDEAVYGVGARQRDVEDALLAHDAWCAVNQSHLSPAGMYTRDEYITDYLGGWFPPNRMYWQADYGKPPELFPSRPLHQFTSTPVDTDAMLESEIVSSSPPQPTSDDPTWVAKKSLIVQTAGELRSVADQLDAEVNRSAPRKRILRPLIQGVRERADTILS